MGMSPPRDWLAQTQQQQCTHTLCAGTFRVHAETLA
jgi:hypothetical protein